MPITSNFTAVLLVTGAITALPVFQFLFPTPVLKLMYKIELTDPAGLPFARHWGLLCGVMGGLLIFASAHPELRGPIVTAALLEKAGLAGTVASQWSTPHGKGMRPAAIFDSLCCLIYGLFLLHLA